MLLLPESVKEFVRLGEDLGHEGVLIEVFDVENLPSHSVIRVGGLVDVGHQVFILKIHSPELFVVINIGIKNRRLLHVNFFYLAGTYHSGFQRGPRRSKLADYLGNECGDLCDRADFLLEAMGRRRLV